MVNSIRVRVKYEEWLTIEDVESEDEALKIAYDLPISTGLMVRITSLIISLSGNPTEVKSSATDLLSERIPSDAKKNMSELTCTADFSAAHPTVELTCSTTQSAAEVMSGGIVTW